MPAPKNLKEVKFFVQTCSWYRRFFPKFSNVARPMMKLTKKDASWEWREEQQSAFETLNNLLTSFPILAQNDSTKPHCLKTDGSDYVLGAVLLQGSGAEEHPIEYATTEKETLAL